MSSNDKDRIGGDVCKHHAARAEKDLARVCPSKLSKRELEDLYYSLLDNNLELKRAVNGQNEKIRLLTTKVNRMTAQNKSYLPKDQRDCCAGAKAIINDQKASIADLKKANECMSERIKRLNMRLCSAKQFLQKSPSQTINKCYKCFSGACTSVKNQSTSALNNKGSDSTLKDKALLSPDRESPERKTVETNTIQWEHLMQHLIERSCDENKCRSTMNELKQKIVDLQEELLSSHRDHSHRMNQLEQQVGRLQAAARTHSDHALRRERDCARAEGETEQLQMQLSTEKLKVAELETRLKAANMSKEVSIAIEKHLAHASKLEESRPGVKRCVCNICPRHTHAARSPANTQTEAPRIYRLFSPTFEDKQTSDDSGYAEQHQDSQNDGMLSKLNEEFMNKIGYLQEQLNYIKSVLVGPSSDIPSKSTFDSYDTVVKEHDVPILKNVKDYNCVIVDPKAKVIVELAHVNKDVTDDDDDEIIDSDIEGNYNEKVKTKDQSILSGIQSPENVEQEVNLNDNVKPLGGNENSQVNNTELETPTRQHGEFCNTVKCKRKVICQCPKYVSEAAKNSETSDDPAQSRDIFDNRVHASSSQEGLSIESKSKPDTHNSLQIPGPLPISKTDSITSKTGKASKTLDFIKSKDTSDINTVGIPEGKKVSVLIDKLHDEEVRNSAKRGDLPQGVDEIIIKIASNENVSVGKNIPEKEKPAQNKLEANENIAELNDSNENMKPSTSIEKKYVDKFGDVDTAFNERMDFPDYRLQNDVKDTIVRESKTVKEEVKWLNENAIESVSGCRGKQNTVPESRFAVCGRIPVCLCPEEARHATKPCGALAVTPSGPKCCKCATLPGSLDSESKQPCLKDKRRRSSAGNTYTLPSPEAKCSRATSPDNTECEISFMSDLPTEKEGTSQPSRSTSSPGEQKMTTTYRESYTPCHWSSLSEGEVPNAPKPKKKLSISVGECPGDENSSVNPRYPEAAAERMEAALQSITRELARCRAVLQSQRPREPRKVSRDAETFTSELNREESLLLRRSRAYPSLGGITVPKCIFILHIGTIVLSDEAVINSREAPLILMWKFFDQSVTMTRMSPGRVVHFDFSTEYEVRMTEDFIEYMKHTEMPIKICELDNKENLFAMCTLPLREALLNANRRADLSLELVTAHQTNRKAHDSLDTSDEVGVLDLWCMLRADQRNLMALQKACGLGVSTDSIDEVQSYDGALSQDLEMELLNVGKPKRESVLENDKYLVNRRITISPQKDFYVPEIANASSSKPPAASALTATRHQKLAAPSVTSTLGVTGFEKQLEKRRRISSGTEDASNKDLGSSPNIDKWRTLDPAAAIKEIKPNRELQSIESVSLSRKKHRESSGGPVKMLKSSKEDNSTQSMDGIKKVTIAPNNYGARASRDSAISKNDDNTIDITVLWLALNEECEAMMNPKVRRIYVAYSFLGRDGAELETPVSLPKPKYYVEKCFFNFKKSFHLTEFDMPVIEHMAKCRSLNRKTHNSRDCIVFSVVSEPPEDPLGLENCEDIGYAYLYLGDLLSYGAGDTFTQVLPIHVANSDGVCGVLAVRVDGMAVLRARLA